MKTVFTRSSEKELLRFPKPFSKRIFDKIISLSDNPYPIGYQKLTGKDGYRIRVGDYRVVYIINKEKELITIIKIGHRKEVYRN